MSITRARRRVFLLAEGGSTSPFDMELLEDGYDVTVFGWLDYDVPCPVCMGRLRQRENKRNIFYRSNRAHAAAIPACGKGLPVKTEDAFRCRDCNQPIEMRAEARGYGPFLGCSNYPACKYSREKEKWSRTDSHDAAPSPENPRP